MHKLNKILSALFVFIVVFYSSSNIFVSADEFDIVFTTTHISDMDGMLDSSEINALESRIQIMKEKYGSEHVVILNNSRDWSEIRGNKNEFAKKIYRNNDFGFSDNKTGSILLVDFYPPPGDRDIEVVTFGRLADSFQSRVDNLISEIGLKFADGKVYEGVNHYLDTLEDFHRTRGSVGEGGEFVELGFFEKLMIQFKNLYLLFGALFAAFCITFFPFLTYKGTQDVNAYTYEQEGQFALTEESDVFSHSHTTRIKIPESNSSSGSSGGGSGGSTGGGSGKF